MIKIMSRLLKTTCEAELSSVNNTIISRSW